MLVDMLVQLKPELYGPFVVMEKGKKVLYVQVLKALYGMLVSGLLWFQKLTRDLENFGFTFNPYDPCVANRTVNGYQHTIRLHVDDIYSSCKLPKANDELLKWMEDTYGKVGKVKATRGRYT